MFVQYLVANRQESHNLQLGLGLQFPFANRRHPLHLPAELVFALSVRRILHCRSPMRNGRWLSGLREPNKSSGRALSILKRLDPETCRSVHLPGSTADCERVTTMGSIRIV